MNRTLVVMLKDPRAGQVKTRLGRDIGMTSAAWWYRHQTRALLRRLGDPRWSVVLAVCPDVKAVHSCAWPAHLPRMPQGPGGLGNRMTRALKSQAPGPVCLIGSDIPGILPAHIERAFRALGKADAIFGPAPDGGFWLVGLKHPHRAPASMFAGARWSTEHALDDTLATLPGMRIAQTDMLCDVDTADDLR